MSIQFRSRNTPEFYEILKCLLPLVVYQGFHRVFTSVARFLYLIIRLKKIIIRATLGPRTARCELVRYFRILLVLVRCGPSFVINFAVLVRCEILKIFSVGCGPKISKFLGPTSSSAWILDYNVYIASCNSPAFGLFKRYCFFLKIISHTC